MKKINLLSIIGITYLSLGEISYATPIIFPHGIASSATVVTPDGVTQGTIGDTVTKAQGSVQQSQVNVANGVAGLDADGHVYPALAAKGASRLLDSNGISVVSINPSQGDGSIPGQDNWAEGSLIHPHALTIGNARVGASGSESDHNPNGQMILSGSPDGPDTNGCLVCVFDTTTALNIAGISGGGSTNWVNGPSGISQYGSADSPVEYILQDNANMQILNLQVAAYTASGITLASPMSVDQMDRIHHGMYVISNSVDPSLPTPVFSATSSLPSPNYYASTVVGVIDATHIQVSGWAVPGAGNNSSGQIPSVSKLDSKWTNFGTPTVGIGGRTNTSAVNWVTNFTTTNSWLNNYENEIDILGDPGFAAGRMRVRGLTMTYQGPVPSADSWAVNLNTYQLPVQLHMEVRPDGYGIQSSSFMTRGNSGVGSSREDWELFEHAAFTDASNDMRIVGSIRKEGTNAGWTDTSATIGLRVDGNQGDATAGSPMGRITFNPLLSGNSHVQTGGWALGGPTTYQIGTVNGSPTILNGQYLGFQTYGWKDGDASPILQAASPSQLNLRDTGGNGITFDTWELNVGGVSTLSTVKANATITATGQVIIVPDDHATDNINPFLHAKTGTDVELINSIGTGVIFTTFGTVADASDIISQLNLRSGSAIRSLASDGSVAGMIVPDVSGNWVFGTQKSGGANVSGINEISAQAINLSKYLSMGNLQNSEPGLILNANVFEGLTGAPDSNLKQGYSIGWNTGATSNTMGNSWGGMDFYDLKGIGPGGFNWCVGSDSGSCKSNVVASLSANGTFYTNNVISQSADISTALVIPFVTPSSSTSTCTQGQIEMDADYIYTCVATNTWHRTSNGTSW